MDQSLEIADSYLVVAAVVIRAPRHPEFPGAFDEGSHCGMVPVIVGDQQVAFAPMEAIVANAEAPLPCLK
jgi:hypothetical protein